MSTANNLHLLKARIAEALSHLLAHRSNRDLGRQLGCAGTTVSSRGQDLHAWPADDLLELAVGDEAIGAAVIALIRGEQSTSARAEAVRVREDMVTELKDSAAVDAAVLANLDKSSPIGRETIRAQIALRRCHEDQLLADLDAMDRVNL